MSNFQEAMPHGQIKKIFDDVFFVTGSMKNEFFGSMWQFSRNMTIVRENRKLSILNSVRLDEEGLKALDDLGEVTNIIRLGDMHGVDDPFYLDRYQQAKFWALPDMGIQDGIQIDKPLVENGEMPFSDSSLFIFKTVTRPECIIRLNREGGIMISCDALQNWTEPDCFFCQDTVKTMTEMDFFKKANLGPAWMHGSQPKADDFIRLKQVSFKHALCGHGEPLLDIAQQEYHKTFNHIFDI